MKLLKKGEFAFALDRRVTIWGMGWLLRYAPRARQPAYRPTPQSLLYVPASSLPYHISGYTTRTRAVIHALRDAGADMHVLTRPGYPWDRKDRIAQPGGDQTVVDGVVYRHARGPSNNRHVAHFSVQAAKVIAEEARRRRVAVIHAASNHFNALPALLAARKLGIPFHYEMRGLWELTCASRHPWYENSARYHMGLALEGLVAKHADRLFVISDALGVYAQQHWGIPAERMALLPNCIDPDEVLSADSAQVEPNTIGYAGSLIVYEGLDILLEAAAMLVQLGRVIQVRIAGEGEARRNLEDLAQRLGLGQHVQFLGRMEPAKAKEMISRCAMVCIPRKPFQVCQIVPPIKLVEALAMGKPVIVPDLPVFRDEMGANPAGWFFRAGDSGDLARVIGIALSDVDKLKNLGTRAREYATTKRRWQDFVGKVLPP
jgi:glycosyltransferase involved in cell wall biosynthesis